jgi:enediyne biosynthesis protein E4
VTLVDIDGDGLLDIYVTYAGNVAGERRANELYVNQGLNEDGVPTFLERAAEYGLADEGYSTHAVFFDYDGDGLLDVYLVNNSFRPVSSFGLRNIRHERDPLGGDKLYRNVGGRFVDVSEEAGIFGSEIGFGLGAAVADVNRDGWPDIYVSNDFFERDYLYLNNGDGTFTEVLDRQMPYISYFSMGLDIADITNDGWPDIYVTDMLPEGRVPAQDHVVVRGVGRLPGQARNDYHHQYMRNMLHRNNGDGTFSEIGQLAGVARDGLELERADRGLRPGRLQGHLRHERDAAGPHVAGLHLVPGARGDHAVRHQRAARGLHRLVEAMTSTPLPNYAFRNNGNLTFTNVSDAWGLNTAGFSNGAAYGDLNGDGALDLVVNNINQDAGIYRNNARALRNRYLQLRLEGEGPTGSRSARGDAEGRRPDVLPGAHAVAGLPVQRRLRADVRPRASWTGSTRSRWSGRTGG